VKRLPKREKQDQRVEGTGEGEIDKKTGNKGGRMRERGSRSDRKGSEFEISEFEKPETIREQLKEKRALLLGISGGQQDSNKGEKGKWHHVGFREPGEAKKGEKNRTGRNTGGRKNRVDKQPWGNLPR